MSKGYSLRWAWSSVLVTVALLAVAVAPAAQAAPKQTRYSLVHGCYALTSASGRPLADASQVRMQATTLGRYLLYRPDRTFLAAQTDGSVKPDAAPSPAADWRVKPAGAGLFSLTPVSASGRVLSVAGNGAGSLADPATAGNAAQIRFVPASGCAVYPEAPLDATGTPSKGSTEFGRVGGLVEGHMHWMTFEFLGSKFHCGRPWHPYGIAYALPGLLVDRGPAGHRRALPELPQLRQPGAAARHERLPAAHLVVEQQPDLRRHVLALGPARVDGRPAADGDGHQREPRALRAAGEPHDQLQRDGHGAARPEGHPRAPALRRRPGRRARARGSSRSSPTRTTRAA